jgi:hypothetical protein
LFLSKNKTTSKDYATKPTTALSAKKLTPVQKKRLTKTLAQMPPIEKLDPAVYAKLESSIRDAVAKTLPEYQKWVKSSLIAAQDCPTPQCSSCGNDCPTPQCSSCGNDCPTPQCSSCGNDCPSPAKQKIDDRVVNVVNEAMMKAIRQALKKQFE